MEKVTKEIYRDYLCERLEATAKDMNILSLSENMRLELLREMDRIVQQLYLLDKEQD